MQGAFDGELWFFTEGTRMARLAEKYFRHVLGSCGLLGGHMMAEHVYTRDFTGRHSVAGFGIPELEARHFETGFQSGRVLVTVDAGSRVLEAMAILDRHGADTGPARGPGAIGS
jgi:hypothetical protein